jgi:uncharacterized protein YndB with AHSA1/START domain
VDDEVGIGCRALARREAPVVDLCKEFEDPAQNNEQAGEYLAVEPDRRLALPWTFPFSDRQTTVEYRLEGSGGGTKVEFAHSGFESGEPWDTARERFTGGWRMFLEGLKRYVEDGVA